jgi:hypothetical protein
LRIAQVRAIGVAGTGMEGPRTQTKRHSWVLIDAMLLHGSRAGLVA